MSRFCTKKVRAPTGHIGEAGTSIVLKYSIGSYRTFGNFSDEGSVLSIETAQVPQLVSSQDFSSWSQYMWKKMQSVWFQDAIFNENFQHVLGAYAPNAHSAEISQFICHFSSEEKWNLFGTCGKNGHISRFSLLLTTAVSLLDLLGLNKIRTAWIKNENFHKSLRTGITQDFYYFSSLVKSPKIENSTFIFEHMKLRAKLLDCFLRSNKRNINQY